MTKYKITYWGKKSWCRRRLTSYLHVICFIHWYVLLINTYTYIYLMYSLSSYKTFSTQYYSTRLYQSMVVCVLDKTFVKKIIIQWSLLMLQVSSSSLITTMKTKGTPISKLNRKAWVLDRCTKSPKKLKTSYTSVTWQTKVLAWRTHWNPFKLKS